VILTLEWDASRWQMWKILQSSHPTLTLSYTYVYILFLTFKNKTVYYIYTQTFFFFLQKKITNKSFLKFWQPFYLEYQWTLLKCKTALMPPYNTNFVTQLTINPWLSNSKVGIISYTTWLPPCVKLYPLPLAGGFLTSLTFLFS